MKKLILLTVLIGCLTACSSIQIQHPDFEQSPCSCLEVSWPQQGETIDA